MMKRLLRDGFILCIGVSIGVAAYSAANRFLVAPRKRAKQIAIVLKNLYMHEAALSGLLGVLAKENRMDLVPSVYYADAKNKMSDGVVVEKALDSKPDLLVSIGGDLSQVANNLIQKRSFTIPLVFVGATDPVSLGLVKSIELPGGNVTGANAAVDDKTMGVRLLLKALPYIRKIALPYYVGQSEYVDAMVQVIKAYAETRGVEVLLLPVDSDQNCILILQSILPDVDALMHLQMCAINRITDTVAKLCKQAGVIFYSPDPLQVLQGCAPFGFGARADESGKRSAELVSKILVDGVSAGRIPVQCILRNQRFVANLDVIKAQNIVIDEDQLLLASRSIIIKNDQKW